MSVKPILFNSDMVRAILESRKTVTRRVVKPQPVCYGPNLTFKPHKDDFFLSAEKGWLRCRTCGHDPEYSQEGSDIAHHWKPPYQLGDILYVRETWQCINPYSDKEYVYKASCDDDFAKDIGNWCPSIHMPKAVARIWLKVTAIRMERLQDITDSQAENEGVDDCTSTANGFFYIWDRTIKKQDIERYGWDANPWVWVIEFERCEKPQGE